MRKTFISTLIDLAREDERIVLLTGDLGFMVLEPFQEQFPRRFFNIGVAEQNMLGIATGLADSGYIPFVYSINPFATLRPYEFIRNGAILHQLPVRVVAVGGGFEYSHAGPSHYGVEDIGVMRVQPGIQTYAPADYQQMRAVLMQTWDIPGPVFYRVGKNDRDAIAGLDGAFDPDRVQIIREEGDVLILSTGSVSVEISHNLSNLPNTAFGVIAALSPAPIDDLRELLARYDSVVTVEEHYINGGLGSLVAEVIAENNLSVRLKRMGIRQTVNGMIGSRQWLLDNHDLGIEAIAETVKGLRR